jgi:two-component system nitrogen regulation response regulator GlnG/two-component system response regulator HydG
MAESFELPSALAEPVVMTLVIVFYPAEPARVGELAIVPSEPTRLLLGRGASGDEPRLRFFRPRPGKLEPAPPLSAAGLSRRQLLLHVARDGVQIENVGGRSLRVDGHRCTHARLAPGCTLAFGQELVLLCVQRSACPAPLHQRREGAPHAFGEADADGIVGESPAIWRARDELAFAARSGQHVLILGESGVGKELAARAVHRMAGLPASSLIARNAATVPTGLVDAELFGNVRNYPNPGMAERPGLIGQADGGTLFLDEIGELPIDVQSHLLRVLDSGGEYQRLGETKMRRSSFRLLAATNRQPEELRHDLAPRLSVRVHMPPLAARREDIPLLIRAMLQGAAVHKPELVAAFLDSDGRVRVDASLVEALLRRDYPGNTRDLHASLWEALAHSTKDIVQLHHAGAEARQTPTPAAISGAPEAQPVKRRPAPTPEQVRQVLAEEQGSLQQAAQRLGFSSRFALRRWALKHGLNLREP